MMLIIYRSIGITSIIAVGLLIAGCMVPAVVGLATYGGWIWVSSNDATFVSGESKRKLPVRQLALGHGADVIQLSPDGKWLFVGHRDEWALTVVDLEKETIETTITLVSPIQKIVSDPRGKYVYFFDRVLSYQNTKSTGFTRFNMATMEIEERLSLPLFVVADSEIIHDHGPGRSASEERVLLVIADPNRSSLFTYGAELTGHTAEEFPVERQTYLEAGPVYQLTKSASGEKCLAVHIPGSLGAVSVFSPHHDIDTIFSEQYELDSLAVATMRPPNNESSDFGEFVISVDALGTMVLRRMYEAPPSGGEDRKSERRSEVRIEKLDELPLAIAEVPSGDPDLSVHSMQILVSHSTQSVFVVRRNSHAIAMFEVRETGGSGGYGLHDSGEIRLGRRVGSAEITPDGRTLILTVFEILTNYKDHKVVSISNPKIGP